MLFKFPTFFRQLQSKEIKDCLAGHANEESLLKYIDLTQNDEKFKQVKQETALAQEGEEEQLAKVIIPPNKRKQLARRKIKPHRRLIHCKKEGFYPKPKVVQPEFEYGIGPYLEEKQVQQKIMADVELDDEEDEDEDADMIEGFSFCSFSTSEEMQLAAKGIYIPSATDSTTLGEAELKKRDKQRGRDYVFKIVEAIKRLNGIASGAQITDWILHHDFTQVEQKKMVSYRVNAILSSKKYSDIFTKKRVPSSHGGRKLSLWTIRSGSPAAQYMLQQSDSDGSDTERDSDAEGSLSDDMQSNGESVDREPEVIQVGL